MNVEKAHVLVHRVDEEMKAIYPNYRVDVHVEPYNEACESCDIKDCTSCFVKDNKERKDVR